MVIRMVLKTLLAGEKQQSADHDGAGADPDRDVDRVLVLDRHLQAAELEIVAFAGVGESSVDQPENAGRDQYDGQNRHGLHARLRPLKTRSSSMTTARTSRT